MLMKDYLINKEEIWVDCYLCPDLYQVSSLGRLRSKDRYSKNSRSKSYRLWKGKVLVTTLDSKKKYLLAKLKNKDEMTTILLHRLIAFSFFDADLSLVVNHKNGIKTDNRIENLETVTQKENIHHAIKTGLWRAAKGSDNGKASINEDTVIEIRKLRKEGLTYNQISKKLNASIKVVGDICRGRTWLHI